MRSIKMQKRKAKKRHGFRKRSFTRAGRRIMRRRRRRGRGRIAV